MFITFFSLSLFVALIRSVLAQSGFTAYTPAFVQCQQANITWTDTGYPPYDILIVPADDPCGEALADLGNQTSTSITWKVDLAANTQVILSIMDANGNEAWSGTITVGSSDDASCLTNTASSSHSGSVSGTAPTLPPSRTPAATTSSPATTTFAPAGAAGAGIAGTSGALSTTPLGSVTLLGSAVLAVVAFIL